MALRCLLVDECTGDVTHSIPSRRDQVSASSFPEGGRPVFDRFILSWIWRYARLGLVACWAGKMHLSIQLKLHDHWDLQKRPT